MQAIGFPCPNAACGVSGTGSGQLSKVGSGALLGIPMWEGAPVEYLNALPSGAWLAAGSGLRNAQALQVVGRQTIERGVQTRRNPNHIAAKSPPPDSGLVDSSERKSLEYLSKEEERGGSRACRGVIDFQIDFNSRTADRGRQRNSCRRVSERRDRLPHTHRHIKTRRLASSTTGDE